MKRVLFAVLGTVFGLVALLSFKSNSHPLGATGPLPAVGVRTPAAHPPTGTTTSGGPPARRGGSASAQKTASPANAQYLGQAVETPYGIVQVQVTVSGRHLDAVRFAKLTAFDSTSQQINAYAAHILLRETMAAQSSHVDTVTGATYTSDGYLQSLQSALDQAGIA
jgi:uncharacterized protein with FMN-binding domain